MDSYGPVTDNAQSVFELSMIETLPNITQNIKLESSERASVTFVWRSFYGMRIPVEK